jgi:hypothetical protein
MSHIQSVGFFNDQTGATTNITLTQSTTAGSTLIFSVVNYIDTKHVTSVTAGSSTVTVADYAVSDSSDNFFVQFFSIPNVAGGISSVSVTMSASGFMAGQVSEESGLLTTAPFDQATGQRQAGVTSWTSGNVTTTQALEVAYGISFVPAVVAGASFGTPGVGWSVLTGTGITAGVSSESTAGISVFGIRQNLSSTGTYSANASAATNDTYYSVISTYKAASGGTAYTLTAAQGSFAFTGENAARDIALPASGNNFGLTGYTAAAGRSMAANKGAFSLVGFDAAMVWSGASNRMEMVLQI